MERGLTKQKIMEVMTLSPHGDLSQYRGICGPAAKQEPEFMAHFIAYLAEKSQVRDINLALPVITLAEPQFRDAELLGNSLAHLAKLSPRELWQAIMFSDGFIRNKDIREVQVPGKDGKVRVRKQAVGGWKKISDRLLSPVGRRSTLVALTGRYLRAREANPAWFTRSVAQFRSNMQDLYFWAHIPPADYAKRILYERKYPALSSLDIIRQLPNMGPTEAAAAILEHRISFLQILPVLKTKARDPKIVMAMIDRMTPSEVQTNLKTLESFGVKDYPETRAALEQALSRVAKSTKTTLKTTKAVEAIKDEGLKQRVLRTQETQLANLKGIEGNWLVAADKSGSMSHAIETSRQVAAVLAKMVRGRVYLVFFSYGPEYFDVTGRTLEEINRMTRHVTAGGGTSIGSALGYIEERKFPIDGIAIISDAAENSPPMFVAQYQRYVRTMGVEPSVYLYLLAGERSMALVTNMQSAGIAMDIFDLRGGVDYYSLMNIVPTMRVGRYGLMDEIMGTRLLTVEEVLKDRKGEMVTV